MGFGYVNISVYNVLNVRKEMIELVRSYGIRAIRDLCFQPYQMRVTVAASDLPLDLTESAIVFKRWE